MPDARICYFCLTFIVICYLHVDNLNSYTKHFDELVKLDHNQGNLENSHSLNTDIISYQKMYSNEMAQTNWKSYVHALLH